VNIVTIVKAVKALKKGVLKLVSAHLTSETHQNIIIQEEGLPAELSVDSLQLSDRAGWWREKGQGNAGANSAVLGRLQTHVLWRTPLPRDMNRRG
jgi:hypothetical protein